MALTKSKKHLASKLIKVWEKPIPYFLTKNLNIYYYFDFKKGCVYQCMIMKQEENGNKKKLDKRD